MQVYIDDSNLPAMTFAAGDDLLTNVVLSLDIRQGDWWFDPSFGLRRRRHLKNTPATARLIKGDVEQALKWLLDAGRATLIVVTVERDTTLNRTRLKAHVEVTGARGNQVTYDKFVEVV